MKNACVSLAVLVNTYEIYKNGTINIAPFTVSNIPPFPAFMFVLNNKKCICMFVIDKLQYHCVN